MPPFTTVQGYATELTFSVPLDSTLYFEDNCTCCSKSQLDLKMSLSRPASSSPSPVLVERDTTSPSQHDIQDSLARRPSEEPVSQSEQVPASPSPFLLHPLQALDDEMRVRPAEATEFSISHSATESFNVNTHTAAPPESSLDNIHGSHFLREDSEDHVLALAPQLPSIPEGVEDDDGSGAMPNFSIRRSSSASSTAPPEFSTINCALEQTSVWAAPTETEFPSAAHSSDVTNSSGMPSSPPPPSNSNATPSTETLISDLDPQTPELNANDDEATSDVASTNGETSSLFDDDYHSDTSSYTASLLSDVKDYTYENGRRYHSYREGHYVLPNDDQEQDRQDLLHHVRNLVLNGALYRAPIGASSQRVLDLGTGTGIWAIDFADSHPSAEVIGTDLSPIQPSWVPPNLRFIVDDAESPWLFSANRPFDFVHVRDLGGAIADWPKLLRQAYGHLKPGGWIELQEFEVTLKADNDSMRLAPTLCEFLGRLHQASEAFHRPMNIAEGHRQRLVEAGFEDVKDEVYKV